MKEDGEEGSEFLLQPANARLLKFSRILVPKHSVSRRGTTTLVDLETINKPNMEIFTITNTNLTPTQTMHSIKWNYFLPRKFLKDLSKQALSLGWFQSGQYAISHKGLKTEIVVSGSVLDNFTEVVDYLSKRYLKGGDKNE